MTPTTASAPDPPAVPRVLGRVALGAAALGAVLAITGWLLNRQGDGPEATGGADIGAGVLVFGGTAALVLAAALALVALAWDLAGRARRRDPGAIR